MKIILSRKGFDSSFGNSANPILPSGFLLSLPIPDERSPIKYKDVLWDEKNIGPLVEQLTNRRVRGQHGAHLDPDLRRESLHVRDCNWKGLFGQTGAAQGHLSRFVGPGDLFLFFGWFKNVEVNSSGQYSYIKQAPDLHILFGWLQIETVLQIGPSSEIPPWARYHPHCSGGFSKENNSLYVASRNLVLNNQVYPDWGFGVFSQFREKYRLTYPNQANRSIWKLPRWFYPFSKSRSPLTYHGDPKRWELRDDCVLLKSAGRGQEFILDSTEYPESIEWARRIIISA